MTKEDAANILDLKTKPEALADFVGPELAGMVHQAMIMGAEALRGPQPDPITGLVPCRGCAGSYVQSRVCDYGERTGKTSKTGTHIKSHPYLVGCTKCGITVSVFPREAKTRGYTSAKMCAEDLWNRAMGWKGGAE